MTLLTQLGATVSTASFAYVDPATTAMIIQIVAGIGISIGIAVGIWRQKIKMFFQKLVMKNKQKKIEREQKKESEK